MHNTVETHCNASLQKFKNIFRIPTNRLPGWDYLSSGYYFVTICTDYRKPFLQNNTIKDIVVAELARLNDLNGVKIDYYVIMPNHIHGLINIVDRTVVGAQHAVPLQKTEKFSKPIKGSISTIIRSFKSAVTREINQLRNSSGRKL